MPIDKVLLNHLDDQDVLEDGIAEDIDKLILGLSIKDLMNNPEEALLQLVLKVQENLKENYYVNASKNGIELAKNIQSDGDIQIPKSNDPNLNEDVVDVSKGESKT